MYLFCMKCSEECNLERGKVRFSNNDVRQMYEISERIAQLSEIIMGECVCSRPPPRRYGERFYYSRLYSLAPSSLTTHKP